MSRITEKCFIYNGDITKATEEEYEMARKHLDQFKGQVMKAKGYNVNQDNPDTVKYEVAQEQGVPLKKGYNGGLTSEQAGKVGGPIGGNMVKEMIKLAQEQMQKK